MYTENIKAKFILQVASILLNGKKSGVLGNVDEFELNVVRNKIKLRMEKEKAASNVSDDENDLELSIENDVDNEATATQEMRSLKVTEAEVTPTSSTPAT